MQLPEKTAETVSRPVRMAQIFVIISLVFLSGYASAEQVSTVDELNSSYSSKVCMDCHTDTHKGWKNSLHGRSVIDPRVLKTWRTFILSGLDRSEGSRRDLKDICLPCHAPQTKDASDDLIREIATMVITAVEEIDTYESEGVQEPEGVEEPEVPAETVIEEPSPALPEELSIGVKTEERRFEATTRPQNPKHILSSSPWIRDELEDIEEIPLQVLDKTEIKTVESKQEDIPDKTLEPVTVTAADKAEEEAPVEAEAAVPEPIEDFTVTFLEEGETLPDTSEDIAMDVEDLSATLVLDDGEVKIEYSPYDPELDEKEPAFLDRGETFGEKAMRELSKLSINCMICHSMKALPGGNPKPKTIYGTGTKGSTEHMEALGAVTIASDFMKTSEFCAQCHHGCPPGMPSSICPTIWTSYKESYIARGGEKTCQDCHMSGEDRTSHRFPGIYDEDQVKRGIQITMEAEPTRYVYHLQNKIVPAVAIKVRATNNAGHSIPHGCTYTPRAVLSVSVTDQDGYELFSNSKTYEVYSLHLPHNREGYLGLNEWDITAMERLDMGIEPGSTDSQTFVAKLNEDTESVDVEVTLKYVYEEGVSAVIHKETKKIEFESEIEKNSPSM